MCLSVCLAVMIRQVSESGVLCLYTLYAFLASKASSSIFPVFKLQYVPVNLYNYGNIPHSDDFAIYSQSRLAVYYSHVNYFYIFL